MTSYISKFKNERSDNYDTWTKMVWCIMNICKTNNIKERDCVKLVHQFSKISDNYNEDDVDTYFDKNYDSLKETSYGWKYIYECLKEDDEEYYREGNLHSAIHKWQRRHVQLLIL